MGMSEGQFKIFDELCQGAEENIMEQKEVPGRYIKLRNKFIEIISRNINIENGLANTKADDPYYWMEFANRAFCEDLPKYLICHAYAAYLASKHGDSNSVAKAFYEISKVFMCSKEFKASHQQGKFPQKAKSFAKDGDLLSRIEEGLISLQKPIQPISTVTSIYVDEKTTRSNASVVVSPAAAPAPPPVDADDNSGTSQSLQSHNYYSALGELDHSDLSDVPSTSSFSDAETSSSLSNTLSEGTVAVAVPSGAAASNLAVLHVDVAQGSQSSSGLINIAKLAKFRETVVMLIQGHPKKSAALTVMSVTTGIGAIIGALISIPIPVPGFANVMGAAAGALAGVAIGTGLVILGAIIGVLRSAYRKVISHEGDRPIIEVLKNLSMWAAHSSPKGAEVLRNDTSSEMLNTNRR